MGYDGAMRSRFILGLALTAAALVAALAEIAARRLTDDAPLLLSAYDLWYILRPGSLIAAEAHVERLLPWLWDPVIATILAFPAWLLLGPPGLLLIWRYSPRAAGPAISTRTRCFSTTGWPNGRGRKATAIARPTSTSCRPAGMLTTATTTAMGRPA